LSAREAEVASLVLHAIATATYADALSISEATTKKHLTHVFDKVCVESRAQAREPPRMTTTPSDHLAHHVWSSV